MFFHDFELARESMRVKEVLNVIGGGLIFLSLVTDKTSNYA